MERRSPKARSAWSHQKLEEARKGLFPRVLGGSAALLTQDFGILSSEL